MKINIEDDEKEQLYREENGNGIHILTKDENELIEHHQMFYNDLCRFGNNILDIGFPDGMEHYKLTIYSFINKIIELLDTLKVMTENALIDSGFIILRAFMELSAQLFYMINDGNTIKQKALTYQFYEMCKKYDRKKLIDELKSDVLFSEIIQLFSEGKDYKKWYSFYDKNIKTIRQLFEKNEWQSLYENFYVPLCEDVHVSHCMLDILYESRLDKYCFKPYRLFDNHILLLHSVLVTILPVYEKLALSYGNDSLINEWKKYRERTEEYLNLNDDFARPMKMIFPRMRWFFRNTEEREEK